MVKKYCIDLEMVKKCCNHCYLAELIMNHSGSRHTNQMYVASGHVITPYHLPVSINPTAGFCILLKVFKKAYACVGKINLACKTTANQCGQKNPEGLSERVKRD